MSTPKYYASKVIILLISLRDLSAVLFNDINSSRIVEILPIEEVNDSESILVNGMIYRTFKKYYCRLFNNVESRQTLLYGSQGWTFPRQDVNLTLTYPTADAEVGIEKDYLITGYQVLIFTDGLEGSAYINSGGIMQEHISMSFISKEITTLSYQFWLYGAPRTRAQREPENIC